MKFSNYLIFFVSLFHYLIIITSADPKCPESFECGHLGTLEFPLCHDSNPGCGLFTVHGCDSGTHPRIQFAGEGSLYDILENISTNKFLIRDPDLQVQLETTNRDACASLRNLSLHQSPFTSFMVSPNLTMFLCKDNGRSVADYFRNYRRTNDCSMSTVYYNDSYGAETGVIPSGCSMIQLPRKANNVSGGLYDLLTGEFILEWDVSKDCYECHRGGGKCLTDNMNEFRCQNGESSKKLLLIGGVTASFLSFTAIILFLLIRWRFIPFKLGTLQDRNPKNGKGIELVLRNNGILAPRRFRYSEIKKITKSFRKTLGKGGYGSVYKGKLPDGRHVAVKILNESKGNGEEFMNEVASISRTSHVNVVTLLGFCYEGSKRALIYEFMPNGSLEKYIHNDNDGSSSLKTIGALGWQKLFDISVGIARGLEYLHQGCNTRILHFDIKPHNILLDKDFNPKISDFGLARMCPNRSSIVSMMVARGTIGYIAPEVFCRNFGDVSHKSDVYSYGMMVIEIAGGKKCVDPLDVNHTSEIYFPRYLYRELTEMEGDQLRGADLDGIINEDDEGQLFGYKRKLIIVGLWCIQTDPKDRPSMSKVVEMLEGKLESLQIPPKPYLSSPPRSAPEFSTSTSFSTSESSSNLV